MDGINLGQVLTLFVTLLGMGGMAAGFVWAIKANTLVLDTKLALVQEEIKKLSGVVTALAVQDQRLNTIEDRLNGLSNRMSTLDARYEELRHGEGFIFPLADKLRAT